MRDNIKLAIKTFQVKNIGLNSFNTCLSLGKRHNRLLNTNTTIVNYSYICARIFMQVYCVL